MLSVEKVNIQYGGRVLFRDLSFTIRERDRLSFAGPNGAGKSTLMKVIAGLITPDSGGINKGKTITIGYLPQEGVETKGKTVLAEAEGAFEDLVALQEQLAECDEQLQALETSSEEYNDLLHRIGDLQLRIENQDPATVRPRIEKILGGLGFSNSDLDRMTDEFSGGWQMRIALSKLLLREPSVLLLDEPTNHLDIESLRWLENYLQTYRGAIVLISHDRALLDNLTTRTLAFVAGRTEEYAGNYSFYLKESVARKEQLRKAKANQEREIAKTQDFINRFRAKATKARQVQSRIKQLEKIEIIEVEDEDSDISFRFPEPRPSGHLVVEMKGVGKSYGNNRVLDDVNFQIERGDRIAIVGVNGAGKSTFSRILAGVEEATDGECKNGHKVTISYFAQDHADKLDPNQQVLQIVESVATMATRPHLRTLLGCFLFKGDDVFKPVGVLSGGERGRIALVRMLLQPANFLVLDEPTNHLDMRSQEVLQHALKEYPGTFVIVSHNRSFLDPIVNKVLEFRMGAQPRVFLGNVSYYLEKKAEEEAASAGVAAASRSAAKSELRSKDGSGQTRKEQRRREGVLRQERSRVLKPLTEKLEKVEALIAGFENEKKGLVTKMSDPEVAGNAEIAKLLAVSYRENEVLLEKAYTDWSEISDELEKAEKQLES